MAKMTLLELVQDILNDMSSDEVNSISDTVESQQVAQTIKTVYYDLISDNDKPEHYNLKQLTALGNTNKPNYMQIPTRVTDIKWVKYDKRTTASPAITYDNICYRNKEEFLQSTLGRTSTDSDVDTITHDSGIKLLIKNDRFPTFFTSFDDEYLIFDAYNSAEESTLTSSRSLIYCKEEPLWTPSDSFVPDLDFDLFPLLLAEAKSVCFVNFTQSANPKIEQAARRHHSRQQGRKHRVSNANKNSTPDYGRKK